MRHAVSSICAATCSQAGCAIIRAMLGASPNRFATTRWSLVLAASGDGVGPSADALATLCELYWSPVYTIIRRQGYSVDDARDLTQEFFARVLEKHYFKSADPDRGRF